MVACRVSDCDDFGDAQLERDADAVQLVDRENTFASEVLGHLRLGHADRVAELLLGNGSGGAFACLHCLAEHRGDRD